MHKIIYACLKLQKLNDIPSILWIVFNCYISFNTSDCKKCWGQVVVYKESFFWHVNWLSYRHNFSKLELSILKLSMLQVLLLLLSPLFRLSNYFFFKWHTQKLNLSFVYCCTFAINNVICISYMFSVSRDIQLMPWLLSSILRWFLYIVWKESVLLHLFHTCYPWGDSLR